MNHSATVAQSSRDGPKLLAGDGWQEPPWAATHTLDAEGQYR
jgi:hypothetical protein